MGNEIDNIISTFIIKYNIENGNYDDLDLKVKEKFNKIETYIQDFIQQQCNLSKAIKKSKLTLLDVSQGSGISRSSIYAKADILKKYIDERIGEIEREDILSLNEKGKLENELHQLREYTRKLEIHIIENVILENKIEQLEKQLKHLNDSKEIYSQEVAKLMNENDSLKYRIRKLEKNNVIPLPRD
ncbi:hypothetical protein AB4Z45_21820 [Paenibacillus sp. MCAF9]|uniref:hypothetical protein n=1 Tax=Paenibacillus sp. MCAF9 TaxID=3233046 RepID=UPI003F99A4B2